jgi:tRNA-2-methylthio-N6-dimethylallyladenosine synthase
MLNSMCEVLVEGESTKSADDFCGRTDTNKMVVFPKGESETGQYIHVRIDRANSATLFGSSLGVSNRQVGNPRLAANA